MSARLDFARSAGASLSAAHTWTQAVKPPTAVAGDQSHQPARHAVDRLDLLAREVLSHSGSRRQKYLAWLVGPEIFQPAHCVSARTRKTQSKSHRGTAGFRPRGR